MNVLELTGRTRTHLIAHTDPPFEVHRHALTPFLRLRAAAAAAGIDLRPASAFRDFERQLTLWNAKFRGERPVLDAGGHPLDMSPLSDPEKIAAILHWSAIPGASRHHWGTDLDLVDVNAIPAGYRVQLTGAEFSPGGPFAALARWLEEHAARYGFFRPFRGRFSGVQAEPWHFSFAPVADFARRALTPAVLWDALKEAPLLGRDIVLSRLDELHARYVAAIDWPP